MEHLVVILGIVMAAAAVGAILFRWLRQSSIIAFVVVGIVAGLFRDTFKIPHHVTEVFTHLGIILLLFMAGMEVEFSSLKKRWKLLVGFGFGQILLTCLLGSLVGMALLDLGSVKAIIYFGLCLTFSSTIVVIGYLKNAKQLESLHGQIILGVLVLQDITAVLALVVLSSLTGEGSLAVSLGMVFVKLVGFGLGIYLLSRFVLKYVFRYLARAQDLLFVGALGWALGVAALCEAVHFSPEIGAFMAGAALSMLPYRLEVQDKVEPMKDFGVLLFFVVLGYGLKLDSSVVSLLAPTAVVALFTVFGTPLIILVLGLLTRSKSRPTFMIGGAINQISEFSLILATLCVQAKLFDERIFLLVTLSTLATLFFSGLGHQYLEWMYGRVKSGLQFVDRRARLAGREAMEGFELDDHVVVVKYNELAEPVIDYFLNQGRGVLVVDIDPDLQDVLTGKHERLRFFFADIFDPDTWEEAGFAHAHAIVSCVVGGQQAELAVLRWLNENGHGDVSFLAATDGHHEALELYAAGATYVIQTEELAARQLEHILADHGQALDRLAEAGREHQQIITARARDGRHWG